MKSLKEIIYIFLKSPLFFYSRATLFYDFAENLIPYFASVVLARSFGDVLCHPHSLSLALLLFSLIEVTV